MESEINVIGRGRIKKIQARMDDKKVNWIYIGEGPNMAFATGHVAKPPAARLDKVRLRTVLIPVEGEPIFLCPALLAPGVKETSWVEDVRTPAGGEHFDAIADIFGAKNGHSLRVGIDEKLMWGVVQRLESILEKDLLCRNEVYNRKIDYRDISNKKIRNLCKSRRTQKRYP